MSHTFENNNKLVCGLCKKKTSHTFFLVYNWDFMEVCDVCFRELSKKTSNTCKYCKRYTPLHSVYHKNGQTYVTCLTCDMKYEMGDSNDK
jgi:hypothetical protein